MSGFFAVSPHGLFSLCMFLWCSLFLFCKDISQWIRIYAYELINLNYLIKHPVFKCCGILRYRGLGLQHINLEENSAITFYEIPVKKTRKATDWGKITVNHVSDKGHVTRIYKEFPKLNKKINIPIKAWTKDWKTLHQETAGKDRNRCSMSLAIREMQTKSTMSYHYIPTRMTKLKI